jgi:hypothetical protein
VRRVIPLVAIALLFATGCGREYPVSVPESIDLNLSANPDDEWVITAYYWDDGWVRLASWDASYLPDDLKIQLIAYNDWDTYPEYQADFDNVYAFGDLDLAQGLIDDFNDGVIAPIWHTASEGGAVYEDGGVMNIDIPSGSQPSGHHRVALVETGSVVHREFDVQVDFTLIPGFHSLPPGATAALFLLKENFALAEVSVGIGQYQVSGGPGGFSYNKETNDVTGKLRLTRTRAVIQVNIDIKPGSDPNAININGKGVIPVAVLGSADFDVTQIDVTTLAFAGLDVNVKGKGAPQCSLDDVSGPELVADAFTDLVCQFADDPTTWTPDDGVATLEGNLLPEFGGTPFRGSDAIKIVP